MADRVFNMSSLSLYMNTMLSLPHKIGGYLYAKEYYKMPTFVLLLKKFSEQFCDVYAWEQCARCK